MTVSVKVRNVWHAREGGRWGWVTDANVTRNIIYGYPLICLSFFFLDAFITMSRVAAPEFSPTVYYSAIVAFCTLLCLHIFWFRSVVRMIGEALGQGKLEKDIRSDDDK